MSATVQQLVEAAKKEIVEFDVMKTASVLESGTTLLVDVREPDEYAKGHIKGALNVPRGVLEFRIDSNYPGVIKELLDKTQPIILYCRSGARSALAAQTLGVLGYKSVVSMAGGFMAWEAAQQPIEI